MKRLISLSLALLAVVALISAPSMALAGIGCIGQGDHHADKAGCSAVEKAACAAKLGLSPEECEKFCKSDDFRLVHLTVEGMTCGGCEKGVATCLEKTDGVVKVGTVSHKESYAVVVVDTKDGSDEALIEAVTEKGYKAKVMAFADDAKTTAVAGCIGSKKGCSAKCGVRAACGTKTASKKAADSESK